MPPAYICMINMSCSRLKQIGISSLTIHEKKAQQTCNSLQEVGEQWSNAVGIGPIPAHSLHFMAYMQRD